MIDVVLLGIIRRGHIREQIPLREIARGVGISRNTVRRYLRSETIEPAYAERRSTRAIDMHVPAFSAHQDRRGQVAQAAAHAETDP